MTGKNKDIKELDSSALKVNLERTAVTIEIPEQYSPLLAVVEGHYGLQKKTRELLTELNHPFVNWDYVLRELKSVSIGDFYVYNKHPDGLSALATMVCIYFDVINSSSDENVKDSAVHYLFDYIDAIFVQSNEFLARNLSLFPDIIKSLLDVIEKMKPFSRNVRLMSKRLSKALSKKTQTLKRRFLSVWCIESSKSRISSGCPSLILQDGLSLETQIPRIQWKRTDISLNP